MKNYSDIIIIGAGAAGLSSAIFAASKNKNASILILEKTENAGN